MKLSNIFLSTLAVLLCCTACSKDDNAFKGKDADASLSITVKAAGSAITKGFHPNDENELAGEAKVNNLSVLVFDESGAELIGYGWQATDSEGEATILDVPAMTMRARIVIVSNTPENSLANVTSYSDFESRLAQLSDQSQDNLVMSSPVIETQKPLVKGDNYLGYSSKGAENINGIAEPVEITRLAARLDLVNAKTDFTKTLLQNRTVRIEEVRILNQSTASRYFSRDYWGEVMATGHLGSSESTALNRDIANGTPINDTPYTHYVMENDGSESPTEIQVQATLLETTTYEAETKIFTAVINRNGIDKGYNHNYVKRNYVYRLNITFGDSSFDGNHEKNPDIPVPPIPTPTTGDLDLQVEVVNWGEVNQDVEI